MWLNCTVAIPLPAELGRLIIGIKTIGNSSRISKRKNRLKPGLDDVRLAEWLATGIGADQNSDPASAGFQEGIHVSVGYNIKINKNNRIQYAIIGIHCVPIHRISLAGALPGNFVRASVAFCTSADSAASWSTASAEVDTKTD
jgi:hypothetical protein